MSKKSPKDQNKVAELTADLQRLQADFINFRRRSEEARGELTELVRQDVILQILPLLDNLNRALAHLPKELKGNPWSQGISQVAKQSEDTLRALGVERIPAVGEQFDPHLHEAVGFEDGDGQEEVVIEELQPGYKLGERVLRPAAVKVGKK